MDTTGKTEDKIKERGRVRLNVLEEIGLLKTLGAKYRGSEYNGRRVEVEFEISPTQDEALKTFRRGGPLTIDAFEFSEGLGWARNIVFTVRRASGADGK